MVFRESFEEIFSRLLLILNPADVNSLPHCPNSSHTHSSKLTPILLHSHTPTLSLSLSQWLTHIHKLTKTDTHTPSLAHRMYVTHAFPHSPTQNTESKELSVVEYVDQIVATSICLFLYQLLAWRSLFHCYRWLLHLLTSTIRIRGFCPKWLVEYSFNIFICVRKKTKLNYCRSVMLR